MDPIGLNQLRLKKQIYWIQLFKKKKGHKCIQVATKCHVLKIDNLHSFQMFFKASNNYCMEIFYDAVNKH